MKVMAWLAVIASVGCGDSAQAVDARPAGDAAVDAAPDPFACSGLLLPTTAPDPISLAGTTVTITPLGNAPLGGVLMEAFQLDGTTPLGSATSDAQGAFDYIGPTGGMAIDGYFKLTADSFPTGYAMAATPVYRSSTGAVTPLVTDASVDALYGAANVTRDASQASLGIELDDCNGHPLAGGTVTVSGGTVIYSNNGPSATATATDSSGFVYVFNVPPGHVALAASVAGHALRPHTVIGVAGSVTFTALQP